MIPADAHAYITSHHACMHAIHTVTSQWLCSASEQNQNRTLNDWPYRELNRFHGHFSVAPQLCAKNCPSSACANLCSNCQILQVNDIVCKLFHAVVTELARGQSFHLAFLSTTHEKANDRDSASNAHVLHMAPQCTQGETEDRKRTG